MAEKWPMPKGMGNIGFGELYNSPVTLEGGGKKFNLPCDPIIAVSRQNEIAKRSVAKPKSPGTIKESWAVGDWSVSIGGVIIAETKEDLTKLVKELSEICAIRESLSVTCPPLHEQYDIDHLAIDNLQLPFTPGELNQQFTINATSDTSHELLEEL